MKQQQPGGKAILFIDIQQHLDEQGNSHVTLNLTPEAMQILTSIQDRNIAVLCIAGPQRTGKSFLANRFIHQMNGFDIGPTTNPCTKGIWIWNKPIPLNSTTDLIILDTEGLNSVQRDKSIDMKIFSISLLLSSMFVYNNIGHIDETAIENLSLVAKLSEHICLQNINEGDSQLGDFFPFFYWVLRDFSLDLKGMTSNQYLEKCLQPISGSSSEILSKNEIRDKFKLFFRVRECETLVRPLDEEDKLASIETQEWNSLRPAFIEGVNNFEKKVLSNIKPKTIKNKLLTGKMFMGMAIEYLQAINSGGIPAILNSFESVIGSQIRKIFEEARGEFTRRINQVFSTENLPIEEEQFISQYNAETKEVIAILQNKSKSFIDADQLIVLRQDLQEVMDSEYKIKYQLNQQISQNNSQKAFLTMMARLSLPSFASVDQITQGFVLEKLEEMQKLIAQYSQSQIGKFKYTVFFKQYPSKIFEYFNSIITKTCALFAEDHQRTKVRLQQASEAHQLVQNHISQYEKLTLDLQREVQAAKSVIDTLKREQNWLKKNQESNDKVQFGQIEEQNMIIQKKKAKLQKFKAENEELQDQLHKTRIELNQKKIESQGFKKEIEELRKMGAQVGNSEATFEEMPELISSIRNLKNNIQFMDDFFQSKTSNPALDSQKEAQLHDFEQFRSEKVQLKKDYKLKLEGQRQQFEAEKKSLTSKIEVQIKYIDDIKAKNMVLTAQNDEMKNKLISIQSLIEENEKLKQGLDARQFNLETTSQVLHEFSNQIEKHSSTKMYLENELAYIKSENCKLIAYKEDFPYILRESLKYVLNRSCTLKHSLKQLNQEEFIQIKKSFADAGIELKI